MHNKRILLIVGGGIAAYKALELTRALKAAGAAVLPVLTAGGARFVTALSLAALAEARVREDLWSLDDEAAMGHIALSRASDLIVVCPASAGLQARMAAGIADDLATTLLLATDTPVLSVPAMNVRMWQHPATTANVATLRARGVTVLEPGVGAMACGEYGPGRLPEVAAIMAAIREALATVPGKILFSENEPQSLTGKHILVTAGPTHEPIDPVRYLANRSSGKQGFAIAGALAALGARVTLVAGPVALATPPGVSRIDVETAREMAAAVQSVIAGAVPVDAAVCVAAVADWHVAAHPHKRAKSDMPPTLELVANPDILAALAAPGPHRPRLVVGFAAETDDTVGNALAKRLRKGADWIVANDVSGEVMGGELNRVHLVTEGGVEDWPELPKPEVARRLAARIAAALAPVAAGSEDA
jgi:phosphopantothenoylcysteine decarboxylase/phosphopantothenate--cysteine ligase